jgi:iron complex outermembrane receptor protein
MSVHCALGQGLKVQNLAWAIGILSILMASSATAAEPAKVRDRDRPAKTVKEWVAQVEAAMAQVTRVKLERTETGLDIVLETAEGKPLQVDATKFRREGNSLIAEIPNVVLALPQGQTFVADNPTADIATVQVVQQEGSIRVSVAGNNALPKTEVTLKTGGLAYSLNPEADESDEEIVVTGEREGYRVPNASVGTRTDTPLRDIPQAINVVPQQVIRDTQARSITEALENVPGVVSQGVGTTGSRNDFTIRGVEVYNTSLVNGLPDPQINSDGIFFNVERLCCMNQKGTKVGLKSAID